LQSEPFLSITFIIYLKWLINYLFIILMFLCYIVLSYYILRIFPFIFVFVCSLFLHSCVFFLQCLHVICLLTLCCNCP
jgi:hypothetical protein